MRVGPGRFHSRAGVTAKPSPEVCVQPICGSGSLCETNAGFLVLLTAAVLELSRLLAAAPRKSPEAPCSGQTPIFKELIMTTRSELNSESSASGSRRPDEIERDIEGTRHQIDRTLNELTSKLSPRERMLATAESARNLSRRLRNSAGKLLAPRATGMIRFDHAHALALFRRFKPRTSRTRKRALTANLCLALEVHAQLEEEIFYPALREIDAGNLVLAKSAAEHEEMSTIIGRLRKLAVSDPRYDQTVWQLMRVVLHHVADEESTLLPLAERSMPDRLAELGLQMTRRRMELLRPHIGEVVRTSALSFPVASAVLGTSVLTLAWLAIRSLAARRTNRWLAYSDSLRW